MNNIIKDAISDSWCDYQEQTCGWIEEESAHNHGWKEGYEWILTELSVRGYISDEIVKHYMNAL
jgi:hypothetical protein